MTTLAPDHTSSSSTASAIAKPPRAVVPSQQLVSISASADDSVWGVAPGGAPYRYVESGPPWTTISGQFVAITAAADGTVLGLDSNGAVYLYTGADPVWQPLASPARARLVDVSAGNASNVWAVDAAGGAWRTEIGSTAWTAVPASLSRVSATSDGSLWAVDMNGKVVQYTPNGAQPWTAALPLPEPPLSLGAGAAGSVWVVGQSGSVYQLDSIDQPWIKRQPPASSAPLVSISAGDDQTVWGLDGSGAAWLLDVETDAWQQIPDEPPNALSQISIGDAYQIWALNAIGGVLFRSLGRGVWQPTGGSVSFAQISAGSSSNIWGTDAQHRVYNSQGETWNPIQIPGSLASVSSASDGTVWGVDGSGVPQQYLGANGWQPQPCASTMKQVSVGSASLVFGIDTGGQAYEYTTIGGWHAIATPQPLVFGDLGCGSDGTVMGVDTAGSTYMYYGPLGWQSVAGALQQIAVGSAADVWGIDPSGDAIQFVSGGAFYLSEGERRVSQHGSIRLPQWDVEDPYDETKSTHLWIVNRAAQLAGNDPDYGTQLLELFPPGKGQIGQPFHDRLCQGIYDADFVYNDPVILGGGTVKIPTWKSHFYDPDSGKNYFDETDPTAFTAGRYFFSAARESFLGANLGQAGYELGLSLHYLTDLTQPMHASNFTALSSRLPGYHGAFELYAMEVQADITAPTVYVPPDPGSTPDDLLLAAARAAKPYLGKVCPPATVLSFSPGVDTWQPTIRPYLDPILQQAIQVTSKYLILWMQSVTTHTDWVEGDTAGVGMIVPNTPSFAFSPGGQYSIGSFYAKAGQPYKVTTCCDVNPGNSGSNPPGVYLSMSAGNADEAHVGSAVIMGVNWRPVMLLGFLMAHADGEVPLTMSTAPGDLSGAGSVNNIRVIVETMSA